MNFHNRYVYIYSVLHTRLGALAHIYKHIFQAKTKIQKHRHIPNQRRCLYVCVCARASVYTQYIGAVSTETLSTVLVE